MDAQVSDAPRTADFAARVLACQARIEGVLERALALPDPARNACAKRCVTASSARASVCDRRWCTSPASHSARRSRDSTRPRPPLS